MIYGCSLCPDLIFQTHVRCGSLGKAFTINKQTLFTWLIFREAMRLKHLEKGIHLPHTSKYHPDAIDIYWSGRKTAGVGGLHHLKPCLRKEGTEEGWRKKEMKEREDGWKERRRILKNRPMCSYVWWDQSEIRDKTGVLRQVLQTSV